MKTLTLACTIFMIFTMAAFAQTKDTLSLSAGKQKTASKSRLKIKFLEVTEDSRCPVGVNCIWAGNAKVKVQISNAYRSQVFEINTNLESKRAVFDGWSIRIDNLTPYPHSDKTLDPKSYKVTFGILRLSR